MKTQGKSDASWIDCASPWKRWLALLSVVLLVLVPQAHTALQHGLPSYTPGLHAPATGPIVVDQVSQHDDDDNSPCTLCSVLGSAAQSAAYRYVQPVKQTLKVTVARNHAPVLERWCFEQMSRPPPSSTFDDFVAG